MAIEKPVFTVYGKYESFRDEHFHEDFNSLDDASAFASENLEEYVIYMKMKIEEKRNG